MSEMFLYTVKPRKAIIGLSGSTSVIRTNKSVYLTKEDVFLCLKSATVYRRFANEGFNERVTIDDVERVHRENYISPEDWEKFLVAQKAEGAGSVVVHENETPVAPPVEDNNESKQSEDSSVEDENKEDTVVVDESTDIEEDSQAVKENEEVESDDDDEIEKIDSVEE